MLETEAKDYLSDKQEAGNPLAMAAHADLRSIKKLLEDCLTAGIPAMIGPCSAGG